MDRQDLFDALTIHWSDRLSHRREVLRWLGRFLVAVGVFGIAPWRGPQQAAASKLVKGCKLPGQKCSGKNKCCAKKCTGAHRCGCRGRWSRQSPGHACRWWSISGIASAASAGRIVAYGWICALSTIGRAS